MRTSLLSNGKRIVIALALASTLAVGSDALTGSLPANAQDASLSIGEAVVVSTDALNLRNEASSTSAILTVLPQAAYAMILDGPIAGDDYTWYLIDVDGLSGYVASDYISDAAATGSFAIGDTVYVNTDALNLRESASTTAAAVEMLGTGAVATVLDGPVGADSYTWYQLDVDGVTGWAVRDYLAYGVNSAGTSLDDGTTAVTGEIAYINTDTLNVRDTASLSGSVLETVTTGAEVTVTGEYLAADGYDWALVQTADGTNGYVVADYLAFDASAMLLPVGAVGYVSTDVLNLRDSASLSGSVTAELVSGDAVTVLSASEAADGYLWLQVETSAGTGWVDGEYLAA